MSLADIIRVEGINCKGFGIVAKTVMMDVNISIEAKAIYAYFCSFAGSGNTLFPSRSKILKDLNISKSTYYSHFNKLIEQDYIHVERINQGNLKGRNIYTIVSKPASLLPVNDNEEDGRIMMSGIKSAGYGTIPKAVMQDDRLSIKAKGIYAYFCSLTGSGESAFPRKDVIIGHLGISEKTYYKFLRNLIELNYITAVQRYENGRKGVNDYYLNDTPDETTVEDKKSRKYRTVKFRTSDKISEIQDGKIWDIEQDVENSIVTSEINEILHSRLQDSKIQDGKIQDIQNWDNNKINNNKINSIKINNSINQSKREEDGKIDGENIFIKTFSKYVPERDLVSEEPEAVIESIVHKITEYERFTKIIEDPFSLSVFKIFNTALIEMLSSDFDMIIGGKQISAKRIRKTISALIVPEEDKLFFKEDWCSTAMNNFKNACREKTIHNHIGYMCSCIWNAALAGNIAEMAAIEKDFPY